jgi:hypothetical protein
MWRRLSSILLVVMLAGLSGCRMGGPSGPLFGPPPPPPPAASISSLSPTSATAGGPGFTLTVNGSNFSSGADVLWTNTGNPGFAGGPAKLVSATQLTLQISAANIVIPGAVQVTVLIPNAANSNPATFVINPGSPGGAQLISTGANGVTANGNSHNPVLSFNGRFVAFSSEATNLVAGGTKFAEGYLRDTCLGVDNCAPTTLLVSAGDGGIRHQPDRGQRFGRSPPVHRLSGLFASVGRWNAAGGTIHWLPLHRDQSGCVGHDFSASLFP